MKNLKQSVIKLLQAQVDKANLHHDDEITITTDEMELVIRTLKKEKFSLPDVSGSSLLLDGYKAYKCTDCETVSVKKDSGEILTGYCDDCGHPLWN